MIELDVGVVVVLGIFVAYIIFHVRHWLHDKRVKRLYEQADIRMVGGPFDGVLLDYHTGGQKWPPQSPVVYHLRVEEESHSVPHRYERTEEGEYRFSGMLPPVPKPPWWASDWGSGGGIGGPYDGPT